MDVEAEFWRLCEEAARFDESSSRKLQDDTCSADEVWDDERAAERAMVKIIDLVERHPEHRLTFVHCFSDLVMWRRPAPYLLVAFCMRRLRFPEIPELIHGDADAHKGTAYYADHMNYWSVINHAYLDEVWENALSFDYYRHEVSER
jgi:hypothetical protein